MPQETPFKELKIERFPRDRHKEVKMGKRVQVTYGSALTTMTIPNGTTAAITSNKISNTTGVHQGKMCGYKITAGAAPSGATFTFEVLDQDGDSIYSLAAIAANAQKVLFGLDIPLIEGEKVRLTPSKDPGGDWAFTGIYIYYYPDSYFRI
jgi:hypothetical protein